MTLWSGNPCSCTVQLYPLFEGPVLCSMLCCHNLEIDTNVWRRAPCISSLYWAPPNYVCLLAGYVLCFVVQTSFSLKTEKRRGLSGGEGEYGDSGIFGEVSTTQGLCCHLNWQVGHALCCLSFKVILALSQVNKYYIDHSVRPGWW